MSDYKLPAKKFIAAFDVDAQNTFTPVCPAELPVIDGDKIVPELNAQAEFASIRVASRDAHPVDALWLATAEKPIFTPIKNYPDLDMHWPAHAIVGTKGFDFIDGLDPSKYAYQSFKGIEPDKHPYGACYHDLIDNCSTGVIEFLKHNNITTIICGGLATDYCVLNTVLQLREADFEVVVNLAACRGIAPETTADALKKMELAGVHFVENATELRKLTK